VANLGRALGTSGYQPKEINITSTWADYSIAWSELITGWGNPIALDPKSIVALDVSPSASSATDFDIGSTTCSSCRDLG
jgi:hypothetical protein